MKRRYDSDGITRAERRETNCRKKVKFADTDEEDDLSSEHPAFQGEETEAQNHKGHAASVPKTSEYAFFKKLKEERHQKSLPHSLPEEDDRAERLRSTNCLRGNEDSSVAVILNDVITAKLPTACLPASCVSENPAKYLYGDLKCWRGKSKLKCSPEVVQQPMQPPSPEICRMYCQNIGLANVDQYNESGDEDYSKTLYKPGEVFSRKRNSLLSWVTRSSLPEIGEHRSKGRELASVLLSRLTPKGADTFNSGNLGMKPLIGLLKSRSVSYADAEESYQKAAWESRDIEDGKYLMDNAFSSGLNKYFDGTVSSYKPQTAVAAASKHITYRGEADCITETLDADFPDGAFDFSLNLATMEDGFAAASKHITYRGEADCITETLDADFPDGACDFSLNLATMEDGFIPLHGWNCEDASQSSGGAEPKGDLSMSFADWVLEVGESKKFPSDSCDDLETLPRLPSWTFDCHRRRENSALDEGENLFALSVQPAASPRLYPSAMHAASSKDRDYMARQPWLLLDGIPSHSSRVSNYSFQAEDCSFPDRVLDESFSGKRSQHCPKPVLQSFLISSSFDLMCLSPAGGLATRNGTLTRSPYQVPLASIRDGESEALENDLVGFAGDPTSGFMESPLCLYFNRSSLYFLSIADGEEPSPGLPGILN